MFNTRFYHRANADYTPYGHSWRFWLLAFFGWALAIQFKVGGAPFGAAYDAELHNAHYGVGVTANASKSTGI